MIALIGAGLFGFSLAFGLILWLANRAPEPLDPEQALHTAVELHRIRRRLDADLTKTAIRVNAREAERRGLRELDDKP